MRAPAYILTFYHVAVPPTANAAPAHLSQPKGSRAFSSRWARALRGWPREEPGWLPLARPPLPLPLDTGAGGMADMGAPSRAGAGGGVACWAAGVAAPAALRGWEVPAARSEVPAARSAGSAADGASVHTPPLAAGAPALRSKELEGAGKAGSVASVFW